MYKKFLIAMLLVTATFLTGCRIFDSGSDDNVITPAGTLVKTKVLRPVITPSSSIRTSMATSIRPAVNTEVVVGANVKLILSDGTTYTLTDNGNGEYSAIISNLENAKGFVIEARKGELIVQNIITDIKNTKLSEITTDHITTALTQVTLAFAQQQGLQIDSVDQLVRKITEIQININTLKKDIEEGGKVEYTNIKEFFTVALAEAKTDKQSQETILDKIKNNEITLTSTTLKWIDVISKPIIEDKTLLPPVIVESDDETQITEIVNKFIDALAKAMKAQQLTQDELQNISNIISDEFILNGQNKQNLLQLLANPSNDNFDEYISNKNISLTLRKIDNNTYLADVAGTVTLVDKGSNTSFTENVNSAYDGYSISLNYSKFSAQTFSPDTFFPLIIKKYGNNWKILGNKIKVLDVNVNLIYSRDQANPENENEVIERSMIWFSVDEASNYPIKDIKVVGAHLPEGGIVLEKDPNNADSNQWTYWYTTNNNHKYPHPYPAPNGWPLTGNGAVTHRNGDVYTIKITYRDNTTQDFEFKLSNLSENIRPLVATITFNANQHKINISWNKESAANFEEYEISIFDRSPNIQGDPTIMSKNIRDINITSQELPSEFQNVNLIGKTVNVAIKSRLKNGIIRQYSKVLQIGAL